MLKKYILALLTLSSMCFNSNAISPDLLAGLTATSGIIGGFFGKLITENDRSMDSSNKALVILSCSAGAAALAYWNLHGCTPENRLDKAKKINDFVADKKIIKAKNENTDYNKFVEQYFSGYPQFFKVLCVEQLEILKYDLKQSKILLNKASYETQTESILAEKIQKEQTKRKALKTLAKKKIAFLKNPTTDYNKQLNFIHSENILTDYNVFTRLSHRTYPLSFLARELL